MVKLIPLIKIQGAINMQEGNKAAGSVRAEY